MSKTPPNCTIRKGTLKDAERISALITPLAEEFIVDECSEEGRNHFLTGLTPQEMRERLAGD